MQNRPDWQVKGLRYTSVARYSAARDDGWRELDQKLADLRQETSRTLVLLQRLRRPATNRRAA
jgi:hypothetical protein